MRAGDLRHRVAIRRVHGAQNAKGGFETAWTTLARPWAKVEGLDGREAMLATALQGVSSYRITIRWRSDVCASDQLVLPEGFVPDNARELNVRSVSDPDGRRERLVILADSESVRAEP